MFFGGWSKLKGGGVLVQKGASNKTANWVELSGDASIGSGSSVFSIFGGEFNLGSNSLYIDGNINVSSPGSIMESTGDISWSGSCNASGGANCPAN